MAREKESEIGPAASSGDGGGAAYPGKQFGMPATGRGSAVGFGRRLAALTIDWLLGYLIAGLFAGPDALGTPNFSWTVLATWFVLTSVAVAAFGITPGKAVLGLGVASLRSRVVGVPRALLRTALLALVLPALARDADGRGWHDRAAATIVVRTRG